MQVLGVSLSTAQKLVNGSYPLTAENAEKLIRDLERTYADVPALISDLRRYVVQVRNEPLKWRGKRGG